jgi:formyl-CoA transferase
VTLLQRPELAAHPDFATTPERLARRREVDALVGAWIAPREADAAARELSAAGVPAAAVRSYAEAARDPHVRERDMLQEVAHGGGAVPVVGPAAKLSRTPTRVRSHAPELGAHTEEILRELRVAPSELDRLREEGVV